MKAEKVYNTLQNIEDTFELIFPILFVYAFAIGFIIIGISLSLTPANPPEFPKWFFIIVGSCFTIAGFIYLSMGIKYTLGRYLGYE
jgi:uncharacterized BrkB/YihY/UPF0761 family membrane protein